MPWISLFSWYFLNRWFITQKYSYLWFGTSGTTISALIVASLVIGFTYLFCVRCIVITSGRLRMRFHHTRHGIFHVHALPIRRSPVASMLNMIKTKLRLSNNSSMPLRNLRIRKLHFKILIEDTLSTDTLKELRNSGASKVIVASFWLHKEDRMTELKRILLKSSEIAVIEQGHHTPDVSVIVLLKLLNLIFRVIDKDKYLTKIKWVKPYISFANQDKGKFWSIPKIPGCTLIFNKT